MKDNFDLLLLPMQISQIGKRRGMAPSDKEMDERSECCWQKRNERFWLQEEKRNRKMLPRHCCAVFESRLAAYLHSNSEQNVFVSVRETVRRRSEKKINRVRLILSLALYFISSILSSGRRDESSNWRLSKARIHPTCSYKTWRQEPGNLSVCTKDQFCSSNLAPDFLHTILFFGKLK